MSGASLISLLAHVEEDDGWIGHWSPGIGDPTFIGWFTVVAYLVTAYLCRRVYLRLPAGAATPVVAGKKVEDVPPFILALLPLVLAVAGQKQGLLRWPANARMAALWLGSAIVLVLLGINKQLDLQSAITEVGRMVVRGEGWQSIHRILQAIFISCLVLVAIWMFRSVLLLARGSLRRMWPALAGTAFILLFVAIRAVSFHHIDYMLGADLGGFTLNWVLELGGIGLIAYGAIRELGALGRRPKRVMATQVGKVDTRR